MASVYTIQIFITFAATSGFSPRIVQEATEYQTVMGLVAAGIGITVIPVSANKII